VLLLRTHNPTWSHIGISNVFTLASSPHCSIHPPSRQRDDPGCQSRGGGGGGRLLPEIHPVGLMIIPIKAFQLPTLSKTHEEAKKTISFTPNISSEK
jgi:hypothetical protein